MIITTVKDKVLPTIGTLHGLAMKHIFNKQAVSSLERSILEEGIDGWSKKIDLSDTDTWEIKRIVNALIADERGHFERIRQMLAREGGNYRQFYSNGLPYIDNPDKTRTFGRA